MLSGWEAAFAKYGWFLIGITFGLAAKYALLIKRGVPIKVRHIAADLLLLPIVALIAYTFAARIGLTGEPAALATAFCTVGADRLVKLLTDRFLQRVDSEADAVTAVMLARARTAVAAEQSSARIVEDTIEGRAPAEYAALKPHPQAPSK